jgi:D-proline reductase (dithiol) PrdB
MCAFKRIKNRSIAKAVTHFPSLSRVFIHSFSPWETEGIPWASLHKPLRDSKIAIVTTAGVHHIDHIPFNMQDDNGDPSYRVVDAERPLNTLMITHDYYDHTDADRDINIVFPVERLKELEKEGTIGKVSDIHFSYMGHITGPHIHTLVHKTALDVAYLLKSEGVDAVLLTPG